MFLVKATRRENQTPHSRFDSQFRSGFGKRLDLTSSCTGESNLLKIFYQSKPGIISSGLHFNEQRPGFLSHVQDAESVRDHLAAALIRERHIVIDSVDAHLTLSLRVGPEQLKVFVLTGEQFAFGDLLASVIAPLSITVLSSPKLSGPTPLQPLLPQLDNFIGIVLLAFVLPTT